MANFKFTSADCSAASESLIESAKKMATITETFENLLVSVNGNYVSETSTDIQNAIEKIKSLIPGFQDAINECGLYLENTVKPAYENLEATAKSKIENGE